MRMRENPAILGCNRNSKGKPRLRRGAIELQIRLRLAAAWPHAPLLAQTNMPRGVQGSGERK